MVHVIRNDNIQILIIGQSCGMSIPMSVSQHVPGLHSSFSNRIAHFKEDQSVLNITDVISLKQSASDMFLYEGTFRAMGLEKGDGNICLLSLSERMLCH